MYSKTVNVDPMSGGALHQVDAFGGLIADEKLESEEQSPGRTSCVSVFYTLNLTLLWMEWFLRWKSQQKRRLYLRRKSVDMHVSVFVREEAVGEVENEVEGGIASANASAEPVFEKSLESQHPKYLYPKVTMKLETHKSSQKLIRCGC